MSKCIIDFYYKKFQYDNGKKEIEQLECKNCPIEESCKSQHREEKSSARQDT